MAFLFQVKTSFPLRMTNHKICLPQVDAAFPISASTQDCHKIGSTDCCRNEISVMKTHTLVFHVNHGFPYSFKLNGSNSACYLLGPAPNKRETVGNKTGPGPSGLDLTRSDRSKVEQRLQRNLWEHKLSPEGQSETAKGGEEPAACLGG